MTNEDAIAAMRKEESTSWPGWRPVGAAARAALADEQDRVWMTTEEFVGWRAHMGIAGSRHTQAKLRETLDMAGTRFKAIMSGAAITRVESLACAHALFGLALPIEPNDSEAFALWFPARFGSQTPIGNFLRYPAHQIGDRIRGFAVSGGKRVPRTPGADLIRALAWVDVMGPWSPYGEKPHVKAWDGQEVF